MKNEIKKNNDHGVRGMSQLADHSTKEWRITAIAVDAQNGRRSLLNAGNDICSPCAASVQCGVRLRTRSEIPNFDFTVDDSGDPAGNEARSGERRQLYLN